MMKNKNIKFTKKIVYEISQGDKRLLELIKIAGQIVLREDEQLFKELAKY